MIAQDLLPKTFMLPGWAYTQPAAVVGMWAFWRSQKLSSLSLAEAAASVVKARKCTRQRAYQLLHEGNWKCWRIEAGEVRLHTPRHLAGVAFRRAGIAKRSWIKVPVDVLRARRIQTLRAFCSLAVTMGPNDTTPRAYTAKCIDRCAATVSAYRRVLIDRKFLLAKPQYREDPRGFYAHGRFWRRIPDEMTPGPACQITLTQKPLKGIPSPLRGGLVKAYEKGMRLYRTLTNSPKSLEWFVPAISRLLGRDVGKKTEHMLVWDEDRARRQVLVLLDTQNRRLARYAA